ncbi:MAG: hypothetical protein K9I36_07115 [Bacteroidia bacterium]|nr:hypothetical protein [Bacteroidia bacterium]MCF8426484.1 hypothetical protein [Bacteroidia bacterium]
MKINIFLVIIICLFPTLTKAQLNNLTIKIGHSISVTQWGLSPFSETRRWEDRSVNSIFFNIEYSFKIRKNANISTGLQSVEKGFITEYEFNYPRFNDKIAYQYRLFYLELPINYIYKKNKNSLIGGVIFSYLYDDIYRFSDKQTIYDNSGKPKMWFNSNYSHRFNYYDRYNRFDFGLNLGYSRQFLKYFDLEFTIQKHFINVDNWNSHDLRYNLSFLTGIRYRIFAK